MIKKLHLILLLLCGSGVWSSGLFATAIYEEGKLSLPYVEFENQLYRAELLQVTASNEIDFAVSSYALVTDTVAPPTNTALFAGNVLSIPSLRAGIETYQVQLDYLESEGIFRLLDAPAMLLASTEGVLCDYSDSTPNNQPSLTITSVSDWRCSDELRTLEANGIPDHEVGTFPNPDNPNTITELDVSASFPLAPVETAVASPLGGPTGPVGFVLNGVKIDPGTGGTCDDSGDNCSLGGGGPGANWHIEALGQNSFDFGEDENNAHVQPSGEYHYHGIPEGFVEKRGGNSDAMTLIGWAADGFPIYARYGYSIADNANSPLKVMTGSYQLVASVSASRPAVDVYPLGTFAEDWEYVEGSGDLDECNGRFGVTPEFPDGIYHYYATDSYPYFQRCVTGLLGNAPAPAPDPGDSDQDDIDPTGTYSESLDPEMFYASALQSDASLQSCILSNGTQSTCYSLTITGYPANHQVGPFCPQTTAATAEDGGIWFDGNAVYDIDGDFILGLSGIYNDANWKLYDDNGNVRVTDTPEAFDAAARPDVDPAYQNYCVEGRIEWLENGEPVPTTVLIPAEPVDAGTVIAARGNLGVTLNGVIIAAPAPVDAILGAYTIAAFDDCGGHINPFEGYHLHGARGCSEVGEAAPGETPIFGYALDGYPIHSPLDTGAADLDQCNGHTTEAYGYHYHAAPAEDNAVLSCLRGLTAMVQGPPR